MSAEQIIERLRRFLWIVAGLLCAGTLVELALIEHTEDPLQLLPFALCGIGLVAVLVAWFRPQRTSLWTLRIVMAFLIVGSLFGVYEHVAGNLAFALEIQPTATFSERVLEALGGANPLLAPGMLALAGVLALAATYHHPVLERRQPTI